MELQIQDHAMSAFNKKVWNVRQLLSSMIAFEIGSPVEEKRGQFHFVIDCCHWWLQQDKDEDTVDIVNSESKQSVIAVKIRILNGKMLQDVSFNDELKATIMDFTDGIYLRIAPYASDSKVRPQWSLFTEKHILNINSDGSKNLLPLT